MDEPVRYHGTTAYRPVLFITRRESSPTARLPTKAAFAEAAFFVAGILWWRGGGKRVEIPTSILLRSDREIFSI